MQNLFFAGRSLNHFGPIEFLNHFDFTPLKIFVFAAAITLAGLHDVLAMTGKAESRKSLDVKKELETCPVSFTQGSSTCNAKGKSYRESTSEDLLQNLSIYPLMNAGTKPLCWPRQDHS